MRKYKSISLSPDKVHVHQVQMLPPQVIGGQQMVQFVTNDLKYQYGLTISTNDKRTFNRLCRRLSL